MLVLECLGDVLPTCFYIHIPVNYAIFLCFSHDDSCDQTEAAQDGFNGSQHVCSITITFDTIVM